MRRLDGTKHNRRHSQRGFCVYPDCERRKYARDWCQYHYTRWYLTGDPSPGKKNPWGIPANKRFDDCIMPEPNSGCWLWTGAVSSEGYAVFEVAGKQVRAHRFSYERYRGKIPGDLTIDHLCRVRCCVNPNHLEVVTIQENIRRREHCKGEANGRAKLTSEQVLQIRTASRSGPALAREFGVSTTVIYKIRRHELWGHL